MNEIKKKGKFNFKKFLRNLLILSIFVYIVIRMIPSVTSIVVKTTFPEEELVLDKYGVNAIVLRNEELYKSAGSGNIEYFVKEGERVPSGKHIAQLKLTGGISTYNQMLEEVNKKIEVLNQVKKDIEENPEYASNPEESINKIVYEIQNYLQNKNYKDAEILKEKLSIFEDNKENILGGLEQINTTLEKLQVEKEAITKDINDNIVNYYAKDAGVVSFKVDGFEEVYKYSDRDKYRFTDMKEKPIKKNLLDNKVSENNEPVFKIISNYEWYLVLDGTNIKDVNKFEIGDNIRIELKDEEIIGKIENIDKVKENTTLLCRFNTNFEDFYEQRLVNVDVIRYKYRGYKIPKKAIVESENQKGVIIRDISGITRFRPVEILYEAGDIVYVSKGDESNYIKIGPEDKLVKTVSKFDEIILNNVSVKEGMILD